MTPMCPVYIVNMHYLWLKKRGEILLMSLS